MICISVYTDDDPRIEIRKGEREVILTLMSDDQTLLHGI